MMAHSPLASDSLPPDFVDRVQQRLQLPLPGLPAQLRMAPRPRAALESLAGTAELRPAAALLLLYQRADQWYLPLTMRGANLRHHGGQISLPGGRLDHGETPEQTALREAHEEIGVVPSDVALLGRLTPLPVVVSGHLLQPVVGYASRPPAFVVGELEVERIIEVPLERLQAADAIRCETRERSRPPAGLMDVPFFDVEGLRVWGATAMVLAEFLALFDPSFPGDRG